MVLVTYPDPPLNVREDPYMRGPTHVWLVWDYGISDGGTPIIDYDIYYD